jgi:hypothetical protein
MFAAILLSCKNINITRNIVNAKIHNQFFFMVSYILLYQEFLHISVLKFLYCVIIYNYQGYHNIDCKYNLEKCFRVFN